MITNSQSSDSINLNQINFVWNGPKAFASSGKLLLVRVLRITTEGLAIAVIGWGLLSASQVVSALGWWGLLAVGPNQTKIWLAIITVILAISWYYINKPNLKFPQLLPGVNTTIDLSKYLSSPTLTILFTAQKLAGKMAFSILDERLLMLAIFEQPAYQLWLIRMGITLDLLRENTEIHPGSSNNLIVTDKTVEILRQAFIVSYLAGGRQIEPEDIWLAICQLSTGWQSFFGKQDLTLQDLSAIHLWWRTSYQHSQPISGNALTLLKPSRNLNVAWTARPTPTLQYFSADLTEVAKMGSLPHISIREEETNHAIEILTRTQKNNLLLVGPPGSGRSAIVGKIASKIVSKTAPTSLWDKKIVMIDTTKLLAEAGQFGGLTSALAKILNEASSSNNTILYIPRTDKLVETGSESEGLRAILAGVVNQPGFQFIGTTTLERYNQVIETDSDIASTMDRVEVAPLNAEQATPEVARMATQIELHTGVLITYAAIKEAISTTEKYQPNDTLPDKAVAMLDKTAARNRTERDLIMLPDDVIAMAELAFKMPIASATQAESQKLLGLADEIHQYMIDQEEAVKQIANALQRSRAGLKDSKKPIGSFLFVGPTGVGKTELAKTLAKVYFKGESTMIRLDMSEFQNADSITRLIGGPNQNSSFIDKVKNQPFSLILLDEIEKASGSILDLFLQVLDDGRLTDSQGETVSFRETIIIATSNIGAKAIGEAIAANKNYPELKKITIDELKNNLRLEFINRFDDIIVFKPLGRKEILAITKLMINQVNQTLVSKKISLNLTDAAYAKLAEIGFDPVFGARPLRRTIQDKIEAPLAKALLSGQIKQGNIVTIDAEQI